MTTISQLVRTGASLQTKRSLPIVRFRGWSTSKASVLSSFMSSSNQFPPFVCQHQENQCKGRTRYEIINQMQFIYIPSRSFSDATHNNQRVSHISTNTSDNPLGDNTTSPSKNLRERAVDRARSGARKGSAMAKRGAKSTYQALKQYGPVFIGTYASLYLVTITSIYAGVDSGMIDPTTLFSYISNMTVSSTPDAGGAAVDAGADAAVAATVAHDMAESKSTAELVISYLDHYSLTKPVVPFLEKNPHFANLGVAWVATKFTEPIRLVVSMAIVPKLADYLGYVVPKEPEEEQEVRPLDEGLDPADDEAKGKEEQAPSKKEQV